MHLKRVLHVIMSFKHRHSKGDDGGECHEFTALPLFMSFYFFYMLSSSNIHLKNAHFQLDTWIAASCMWLEI